jgi:micrococcal nuclease
MTDGPLSSDIFRCVRRQGNFPDSVNLPKICIFFGAVALFIALSAWTCRGEGIGFEARVVEVNDGDTVTVSFDHKRERIRLIGIDAPELFQEPWGRKAKAHLGRLLNFRKGRGHLGFSGSSEVRIETDAEERDRYGRLLAYLWTKDGECVNIEMVRDGYALLYTIPPNVRYAELIYRAQREAKEARRGIWRGGGLEELPRQYRREHPAY